MKNELRSCAVLIVAIVFLIAGPSALLAGQPGGAPAPKKLNGTWTSVVTVPPNDILANEEDVFLPELDTFSTSGTVITSAAASVLPLTLDEGFFLASVGIGQGNWKMTSGNHFVMTQWRFLTDLNTGEPFGYVKIIAEMGLQGRDYFSGEYEVHLLGLDMMTPLNSGGVPAVIGGPFEGWRLPIDHLP